MVNAIISRKQTRIKVLQEMISGMKDEPEKKNLINWLIVNYHVSRRLASEEVEAVMDWMEIKNAKQKSEQKKTEEEIKGISEGSRISGIL